MTVRSALYKAGGRNLVVWVLLQINSTIALYVDKLTGAEWKDLVIWTTAALILGTSVEGGMAKFGKGESTDA